MDVLDRGVVHATLTSCFRIQGALEQRAKDGRVNVTPLKVKASITLVEQEVFDLLSKQRNDYIAILEKAAADVRKGFERW